MFLYTGKLIGHCMADAPWIRTYPDIGQRAFGSWGRVVISALLYAELFLTCACTHSPAAHHTCLLLARQGMPDGIAWSAHA